MKKHLILMISLVILPFLSRSQEMSIDLPGVKISFLADMQNTKGTIGGFNAKIHFDMEHLSASAISGTVDVNTIDTNTPKRDEHLKSADYFDAATYPTMSFKSTSFAKEGGKFVMKGMMKIKDIEREETIVFSFEDKLFIGEATIQVANYNIGPYAKKEPSKTNVKIWFEIPIK